MKTKAMLLGAVASIALAGTANASHFNGWYIGLEAGVNWIDDVDAVVSVVAPTTAFAGSGTVSTDSGWAVLATWGYAFDNNWRLEAEVGYRDNTTTTDVFQVTEWSVMANALYDIGLSPSLDLTLGAGVGYDFATLDILGLVEDEDSNFAYQGIVGLSWAVGSRTDMTLTYRYLNVQEPSFSVTGGGASASVDLDDVTKHSLTLGLRYDLSPDEIPAPPAPPAPPPPPPPPMAKNFIVFFGFAKCNITAEADAVLNEAAAAAKATGSATVSIVGHTDSVGAAASNQALSECRANAAKSALVSKGVFEGAISTSGKGESELLVQTGDDVKEPQNRRATVDVR